MILQKRYLTRAHGTWSLCPMSLSSVCRQAMGLDKMDGFSVAFSGGGIRAAAFDCGLLWRLAEVRAM